MRHSKAENSYYFIPLILGLIGLWYTVRKDYRQTIIIGLLFLMTGLAIVIYLNQYAPQPRERDYAYAGSFYAFAIWIGLAIPQIAEWLRKATGWLAAHIIALAAGAVAVFLLASQNWDDHDRSGRYTALATAKNYLSSCAPNAILFTNGDNDTFPLWYAQEVEGFRTDIRVVNLSLLNTDWYIDQMKRKAYDGEPVPFSLTQDKYRQGNHDVTYVIEDSAIQGYVNLKDIFDIIQNDESRLKLRTQQYGTVDFLPTTNFRIPADSASIARDKLIPEKYLGRINDIMWNPEKRAFEKNDLMVLDLLAHNDWKRPVYFAMTMGPDAYMNLGNHFVLEGLAYRLLPVNTGSAEGVVNTDAMYHNVMNKFTSGNMEDPDVYLDDQSQRMVMNYRILYARLAEALISEGKTDSAKMVLDRCLQMMPDEIVPYNYFAIPLAENYFALGDTAKGREISLRLGNYMAEDLEYLFSFKKADYSGMEVAFQEDLMTLQRIIEAARKYNQADIAEKFDPVFRQYYQSFVDNVYKPQ